jgi:adenylate cyclase
MIPAAFATCSPDGTPNITPLSIVEYVDSERVALSRQFLNKTRANLDANPAGQVLLTDRETLEQFLLDLRFLHTESDGPIFEGMKANLEAIASQTGMGDVFRLRGVDIHRVVRSTQLTKFDASVSDREAERDALRRLDDFVRRLALCREYGEATRTTLQALDDLFGFAHAILFAADERGDRLFAVAESGYAKAASGAEVPIGEGVIGVAAERRQVVCVPSTLRMRTMRTAVEGSVEQRGEQLPGRDIPLPGLESVQSVAAVPLVIHGNLVGLLYLESERAGEFGSHNERVLRIVGGHLSTTLAAFERDRTEAGRTEPPRAVAPAAGESLTVTYYQADDSLFIGDEYLIKGVPARILWKLLRENEASGRTEFTNRELRLDEGLGLPPGNDNLEARLLVLRRRLEGGDRAIGLERVARGRLALTVPGPISLVEIPTSGPMRAAHFPTDRAG